MKLLWFIFQESLLAYHLRYWLYLYKGSSDLFLLFTCSNFNPPLKCYFILWSSFQISLSICKCNKNISLVTFLNVVCIWLNWHFLYFLERCLDNCRAVQLRLRTETYLFLALGKQSLQNSHIYKLFNFQMLIKSLAPSAGCASAMNKILEGEGGGGTG